jgi:hypothetical protein
MYPGQTTALEQYPNSGMNIPQIDAIRRARSAQKTPLYAGSEEVMGAKPMAEQLQGQMGGMKPAMDPNARMGTKPMAEGYGSTKPMQEDVGMNKPGFNDPRLSQFGRRKPAAENLNKTGRIGAPTGRGMPGVPGPAPRVRGVV